MPSNLDFIRDLAEQTGRLLLKHFKRTGIEANRKHDNTVVTLADLEADRFIHSQIQAHYPNDAILSEEALKPITDPTQPLWVIDPLDGSTNFALGLPVWGVSIARVVNGLPALAGLSFPTLGELYWAGKGQGAWLNGQPIHAKPLAPDQPEAVFTASTNLHHSYAFHTPYKPRTLGSAAYDLCLLARGASVAGFQATAKLWDIAAGWLLIEEAGGQVKVLHDPQPFPLTTALDYTTQPFPTLMAASADHAVEARTFLQPKP